MVARKAVPDSDHVARFVPKNKQTRHPETDEFISVGPAAFALRTDDKGGMSVNWVEYFGPLNLQSMKQVMDAHIASLESGKLPVSGVYAIALVSKIRQQAQEHNKVVRVVHAPVPGNDAHAEIRHFTDEDIELLDSLASDVFLGTYHIVDLKAV